MGALSALTLIATGFAELLEFDLFHDDVLSMCVTKL